MSKPIWENLDWFFTADTNGGFAKAAVFFSPEGTKIHEANVIFDNAKYDAMAGEFSLEEEDPRMILPEHPALASIRKDCYVVIETVGTFDIMEHPRPDGTGTYTLELAKQ